MEENKVQWLRSVYQEVAPECPSPKKIRMSDLHAQLEEKYLPEKLSHHEVSKIVQMAFPNAETKMATKSRTMHICGIAPVPDIMQEKSSASQAGEASSDSQQLMPAPVAVLLESERTQNKELMERIALLEAKVQILEQMSLSTLTQQADHLLHHGSSAICGPDTPEHFQGFSLDGVIHELQEQAPDMYRFFMQLGSVEQNDSSDGGTSTKEVKAVTSLCTLLNARSRRIKGLQLLLSMMLIARSTSKQVWIYNARDSLSIHVQ